jgi:hypothetical protein
VTEETGAKPVQVTAGSEAAGVDIQFSGTDKGFVVSGRVVDSESKTPIANAMVATQKRQGLGGQAAITSETGVVYQVCPGASRPPTTKVSFGFAAVAPGNYL